MKATKVFLSYSNREKHLASIVARLLTNEKIFVAYDVISLMPGSEIKDALRKELDKCDSMIALLSPKSYSSVWVRTELEYALFSDRYKGKLLPVLIGASTIQEFDRLPWVLTNIGFLHIKEFEAEEKQARRIVKEFKRLLFQGEIHP